MCVITYDALTFTAAESERHRREACDQVWPARDIRQCNSAHVSMLHTIIHAACIAFVCWHNA